MLEEELQFSGARIINTSQGFHQVTSRKELLDRILQDHGELVYEYVQELLEENPEISTVYYPISISVLSTGRLVLSNLPDGFQLREGVISSNPENEHIRMCKEKDPDDHNALIISFEKIMQESLS